MIATVPNIINYENSMINKSPLNKDQNISSDIGYMYNISETLLGHGSYGDVFLATDENGKQVAVKCCDIHPENGIPNILEASIMGTLIHPFLNNALRIHSSEHKLYIVQELAQTDLCQYTRKERGNYQPTIDELRQWAFQICHAVACLHNGNIIHADIKASNILLYSNRTVKLTDFTLATKKWADNENFTHNVCTCTHRPLECLTKKSWNESLDIWSLGCTLYEIAYGELLFQYQGKLEPDQKVKDHDAKIRLRQRLINAIIDWSKRGPHPNDEVTISPYPIDYIPFELSSDFNKSEMVNFNELICKMLRVNPSDRLTIKQILDHSFFQGIKGPIYLSVKRPINKISNSEQARVSRYIQRYSSHPIVQNVAFCIYCRCNNLNNISEHIRAATSTWIASKIVVGYTPQITFPLNLILAAERDICHDLMFRLHVI